MLQLLIPLSASVTTSIDKLRRKKVQLELNVVAAHRDAKGWRDLRNQLSRFDRCNRTELCQLQSFWVLSLYSGGSRTDSTWTRSTVQI